MLAKNSRRLLIASASLITLTLGGCGANDIASPGTGGNITIINNPAPTPAPTPTPTPTSTLSVAATGCPTISDPAGLTDGGTITGPTGSYRLCSLPARVTRSSRLERVAGVVYQLAGRTDVGTDQGATTTGTTNVVLTIDPGVIVGAQGGPTFLAVNRGNSIQAVGTAARPIVFTSLDNIRGLNSDSSSGQWGGVVLLGRAQITDCASAAATPGTNACERDTEGSVAPAIYGGTNNTESSGRMSYVQIRFSGFILSNNVELQSLTTEGTGSGTVLDHIQSFNSSDDGAEFFGGRVNMKYYISVGAEDDNLDTDTGVKANFQYVLVAQRAGSEARGTDSIIEADSDNTVDTDLPRQNTIVSNFTFLHRVNNPSDQSAMLLRGGTDYTLANGVLVAPAPSPSCLRISRAATADTVASTGVNATGRAVAGAPTGNDELGAPIFRSVVMQCGATPFLGANGVTNAQTEALFGAGSNGNSATFTPTLTSAFINGANETAVVPFNLTNVNAASGIPTLTGGLGGQPAFFDAVTYIGAVRDASDTWYRTWTCNSATLDLGTGNTGLCTSLPSLL